MSAIKLNTYFSYTDNDLLRLLPQNDIEALDTLYSRHWAGMYKTAFFVLRDPEACKDVVQDIFVWLWGYRQTLEIQTLKSYLSAAVKFKVANYIRSSHIRESFFEESARFHPCPLVENIEERTEINELKAIINQAVTG